MRGSALHWALLLLLGLLAAGWMLPDYVSRMWSRGHYQYFPFVVLAIGWLLWNRRREIASTATEPKRWVTGFGLASSLVVILLGHLLLSHFVGLLGVLIGGVSMLYAGVGFGGVWAASSILALAVFLIPLPLNLDQELIVEMQFLASGGASRLLDGIGFLHFREGVALVTEQSQFMTEEACSGIRSLFSSLAVVAIYAVAIRMPWWRATVALVSTVVWVVVGNALRVAVVVLLADRVTPWFATGFGHDLLGYAVFAFILLMVASTDACVSLFAFRALGLLPDRELLVDELSHRRRKRAETADAPAGSGGLIHLPLDRRIRWAAGISLVLIALVGFRVAAVTGKGGDLAGVVQAMPSMPEPQRNDLPDELLGWQLADFEHKQRSGDNLFADHSYIWTYRKGAQSVVISLDRPWTEWHNLNFCYRGLGWDTEPDYFVRGEGESLRHSELALARENGARGFVLFTVADRKGSEMAGNWRYTRTASGSLARALLMRMGESLRLDLDAQFRLVGNQLPATTIQLYSAGGSYDEAEAEEYRKFFFEVRRRLLNGRIWQSEG